jgi:hypothetical protein
MRMNRIKTHLIGMCVAMVIAIAFGVVAKSNRGGSKHTTKMIQQVEEAIQSMEDLDQLAR